MSPSIEKTRKRLIALKDSMESEFKKNMETLQKEIDALSEMNSDDEKRMKKRKGKKSISNDSSSEENQKPAKKKTRAEKQAERDPNMPRRPTSAYFVYQNDVIQDRLAENPELDRREVQKLIGAEWKATPWEQKLGWTDPYDVEKLEYDSQMREYNASKGLNGGDMRKIKNQVVAALVEEDENEASDEDGREGDEDQRKLVKGGPGEEPRASADSESDELDSEASQTADSKPTAIAIASPSRSVSY